MRLKLKFGNREFEYEDDTPLAQDQIVDLGNLGRALLLQPGSLPDEDEDEVVELEARKPIGFGPNPAIDEDDEEEDEDG